MEFPDKLPGEDFINSWYPIGIALVLGLILGFRNWLRGNQCLSQENVKKKIIIVTGANSGIGRETSRLFAERGGTVIMACRDPDKAKTAVEEINVDKRKRAPMIPMKLDLASLESIRQFVKEFSEEYDHVDILVNNAGVMCPPKEITEDGHELQWQVNYLGHVLLTHLLLDKLHASGDARIINTTALAHHLGQIDLDDLTWEKREYQPGQAYAASKLAVVLYTQVLAKKLEDTGITVNVMHPGVANTKIHRYMAFRNSKLLSITFTPLCWFLMKSAQDGAQNNLYLGVAKEEQDVTGKYFGDCRMLEYDGQALNEDLAQKLWDHTLKTLDVECPTYPKREKKSEPEPVEQTSEEDKKNS